MTREDQFLSPAEREVFASMKAATAAGKDPLVPPDEPEDELIVDDGKDVTPVAEAAEVDDVPEPALGADDKTDDKTDDNIEAKTDEKTDEVDAEALAAVAGDEDEDDDAPAPFVAPKAVDYEAQRATLRTERREAKAKLNAGEISDDDFDKVDERVGDSLEKITLAQAKVEARIEAHKDNVAAYQERVLNDMQKVARADGIDYATDAKKGRQFDGFINNLMADPDNAGLTFRQLATIAHKSVLAMNGVMPRPKAEAPAAAKVDAGPVDKTPPARKMATPPVTLREMPAAEAVTTQDTLEEQWSKLSGDKAERFWNKLSAKQQDHLMRVKA